MNKKKYIRNDKVLDSNIEGRKMPEAIIRTEPNTKLSKPATKDSNIEKRKLQENILRNK